MIPCARARVRLPEAAAAPLFPHGEEYQVVTRGGSSGAGATESSALAARAAAAGTAMLLPHAATLAAPYGEGGRVMALFTSEPCVQT